MGNFEDSLDGTRTFSSTTDRPEGGIVGISYIAQGCIEGLGSGTFSWAPDANRAGRSGLAMKGRPNATALEHWVLDPHSPGTGSEVPLRFGWEAAKIPP